MSMIIYLDSIGGVVWNGSTNPKLMGNYVSYNDKILISYDVCIKIMN